MPPKSPKVVQRASRRLTRVRNVLATEKRLRWNMHPIRPDTVFWESFNGNGVLCNPEAMFRQVLRDPTLGHLTHVWSLRGPFSGKASGTPNADNSRIRAEFAGNPRVRFVSPNSPAYDKVVATSHWLVSNSTFGRQFSKRPGQLYVNTWHGTPLKRMGYDIGDPAFRVANVVRNFVHADLLLSQNEFSTRTLFENAHRLDGILPGSILESGYPRVDREFKDARATTAMRSRLEARGLDLGDRDVVLWAPTWKGTSFVHPEDDAATLFAQRDELQSLLDPTRFVVLLKTHQAVHAFASKRQQARGVLVPNDIPTNDVLAATSILVTDYSSVFVDFLALDRPIVFFAPDIAEYADYRGFYLEPGEWPGVVTASIPEVADEIVRVNALGTEGMEGAEPGPVEARRAELRRQLTPHDDGTVTEQVVEAVFTVQSFTGPSFTGASLLESEGEAKPRPRILLTLPSTTPAGRRQQVLDVLTTLDLDAIDLTVLLSDSRDPDYLSYQARIDPRVRQLVRQGHLDAGIGTLLRRRWQKRRGNERAHREVLALDAMWNDEWRRLLADVRFDVVVDTCGDDDFWMTLLLHSEHATTVTWVHDVPESPTLASLRHEFDVVQTGAPGELADFLAQAVSAVAS